jgi:hypothetical protein
MIDDSKYEKVVLGFRDAFEFVRTKKA